MNNIESIRRRFEIFIIKLKQRYFGDKTNAVLLFKGAQVICYMEREDKREICEKEKIMDCIDSGICNGKFNNSESCIGWEKQWETRKPKIVSVSMDVKWWSMAVPLSRIFDRDLRCQES